MSGKRPYNPDPHAHPGLHLLALFELAKGLLALIAAASLEMMGPQPIRRFIAELIRRFNLDPDRGALPSLLREIDPNAVHLAVAIAAGYGLWRLVEAWGLWRAKAWASWLGMVGTAAYLPFDVYALVRHPTWPTALIVAINVMVVAALARDLIRRHCSRPR
ncbi:MAG: DUF2127 domain-containing protein [Pseudoxanthomonas sp.]